MGELNKGHNARRLIKVMDLRPFRYGLSFCCLAPGLQSMGKGGRPASDAVANIPLRCSRGLRGSGEGTLRVGFSGNGSTRNSSGFVTGEDFGGTGLITIPGTPVTPARDIPHSSVDVDTSPGNPVSENFRLEGYTGGAGSAWCAKGVSATRSPGFRPSVAHPRNFAIVTSAAPTEGAGTGYSGGSSAWLTG